MEYRVTVDPDQDLKPPPHMRVMGISHIYLAADSSVQKKLRTGALARGGDRPGLRERPRRAAGGELTLAQWHGIGTARVIDRPIGALTRVDGDASVLVNNFTFKPSLLFIPRGSSLTWRFRDSYSHDATVVRGPRGFASKTVRNNNQRFRFTVPGEYKLYCSIHPVLMAQVVKVR